MNNMNGIVITDACYEARKKCETMMLLQYLLKRNIIKAKQGTVSQLCSLLQILHTLCLKHSYTLLNFGY